MLLCFLSPFSISDPTSCLRIKRSNQTYFILCEPEDTIGYLKQQISLATKKEVSADHMRIINKDRQPLEDDTEQVSSHDDLKNDSVLYVVFQIADGEWETIHVEETEPIGGDA